MIKGAVKAVLPIAVRHNDGLVRVPVRGWLYALPVWDNADPLLVFIHRVIHYKEPHDDSAPFDPRCLKLLSTWKVSDARTGYGLKEVRGTITSDAIAAAREKILAVGQDRYFSAVLNGMASTSGVPPLPVVVSRNSSSGATVFDQLNEGELTCLE